MTSLAPTPSSGASLLTGGDAPGDHPGYVWPPIAAVAEWLVDNGMSAERALTAARVYIARVQQDEAERIARSSRG